ncbi:ribosomal protein L4 [Lentithecium fluviatile CBS 122367]|uniref:Large ribosomal subunit protein uL4m n=1 Tax=Lentithecium fluviatile CBS 122367 TaxID=1168545 RepID=A0A6G1J8J6_9PLEO|nr:ribosomal protein L4 [Lentithecium fluviatile CBS 122367]
MAPTRIGSPMRGVALQLARLSIRQNAIPKSFSSSPARSITTSSASRASISSITTSADGYVPVKPFAEQTVLATIHQFPSLEPLRLETYPANHLYLPTRRDILHRAIVYEGDLTREGTASTKTRYEVRGSARKIRPQKGSGRARLGDKKSPMLRGGGVAHGPKPRDFSTDLPKKVYDLAWRTALSYRFRKGELIIVDNAIEIESPSQRLLKHIFDLHDRERGSGRSLMVTLENRPLLEQALDKMDRRRQALTWEEVDVKDLLELSRIIIERSALYNILREHVEDLTHKKNRYLIESSPPSDLESRLGWPEFRNLMQTPASEREAVRPDVYQDVCYGRITHAEDLPDGPEKTNLRISAYELLAESFDLRRKQLPSLQPLDADVKRKEEIASQKTAEKEVLSASISALEAHIRLAEAGYQSFLLEAQAAEHRRDVYNWKGQAELAEEQEGIASDNRTDLAGARVELLQAKKQLAETRAQVCYNMDDLKGYEKLMKEARVLEDGLEEARAEAEQVVGEEEEPESISEEMETLAEEERAQAEAESSKKEKESK